MDMEKEYSCIEKNSLIYHKQINLDENYQETLESYLDDIKKVIKCSCRNVVCSCEVINNEVVLIGKTFISLTYCSDNDELIYTDFEENFTKSITVDNLGESIVSTAFALDKYTSFRVINPRRIDIVSSFLVDTKLFDKSSCSCIKSCNNSRLKVNKLNTLCVKTTGITKIEFDEDISLGSNGNGIERVVSVCACPRIGEIKSITDKFLLKGTIDTTILYTDEKKELQRIEHSFEFSKIVEMSGVSDDSEIFVRLSMGNVYAKAKSMGENDGLIELFGDFYANTIVFTNNEIEIVTDGYVIGQKTKAEYKKLDICCDSRIIEQIYDKRLDFELNCNITKIHSLEILATEYYIKDKKLCIKFCLSAVNGVDDIDSINSSIEKEFDIDVDNYEFVSAVVNSFDYNIVSNNSISVRLKCLVRVLRASVKRLNVLCDISCENEKIECPTLSLYFAKANDDLWDIAKLFSSDISMIKKENEISSDVLDTNKVLVIPGL